MYPIVFASALPIRRQSSVFVTWHRALKVLLFTCRKIVIDPNTCTAFPPNAFILTVGGLRVSHSCLQSFFACLRPITFLHLHPAPVSNSMQFCYKRQSFCHSYSISRSHQMNIKNNIKNNIKKKIEILTIAIGIF